MAIRVGVNGFGRVGRNFFRAVDVQRAAGSTDVEVVVVNELTNFRTLAKLLKYDSVLGRLPEQVSVDGNDLLLGSRRIKVWSVCTQDQNLQDGPHRDLRRARAATLNVVPTSTGAARAISVVPPQLEGRLDGYALRVPVPTGSATDLPSRSANRRRSRRSTPPSRPLPHLHRGPHRLLRHRDRPVVVHLRLRADHVSGDLVKIVGWYDNEWGYSNRLVDLTDLVASTL